MYSSDRLRSKDPEYESKGARWWHLLETICLQRYHLRQTLQIFRTRRYCNSLVVPTLGALRVGHDLYPHFECSKQEKNISPASGLLSPSNNQAVVSESSVELTFHRFDNVVKSYWHVSWIPHRFCKIACCLSNDSDSNPCRVTERA